LSAVIASASEAIQYTKEKLDCFVASAPRNDGGVRPHTLVADAFPSDTPWLFKPTTGVH
jgi:hypothetical protein